MRRGNNYSGPRWAFAKRSRKTKGRPRELGACPTCGRVIAIMRGSGPYADGKGHVLPHKADGRACLGGLAVPIGAQEDDTPRCYVKGCGETENLEPCFVGEYVCPECKVSQKHQREAAGEFALEGVEG